MAAPRIQYARTSDGVSVAYYALGTGRPALVRAPDIPWSHIHWEWEHHLNQRALAESIAQLATYVRYDCRGSGSSQRNVSDLSLQAHLSDLEAVVSDLGLENIVLVSNVNSGPVVIAYAAEHPDSLTSLILWNTYASHAEALATPEGKAFHALRRQDWTIYTESITQIQARWSGEDARQLAAMFQASTTEDGALAAQRALSQFDVTDRLPEITVPTLVVHTGFAWPSVDSSRLLASRIPRARLAMTESFDAGLAAINDFLGVPRDGLQTRRRRVASSPSAMTAILFADIADSTALTERLGDAAFRERARKLDEALPAAIRDARGTIVEGKLLGDGVLATFPSAQQAIDAAGRCRDASAESGLSLHLGIHAGDVIREANNVFGGAVNLAARIADASAPGEILVSDTLRGLARTSAGVAFEDRGERELKGIVEPVRLFAVSERD